MRIYAYAQLAMLAALGIAGIFLWRYLQGKSPLDVARDLKDSTPLGIPSRALDAGISSATGREETLGGFLAEIFDGSTRRANEMMRTPPILPHDNATEDYSSPWGMMSP
jgi:hypothetical protein